MLAEVSSIICCWQAV